tara:strand:- start:1051 stop:1545 length:495 start_codon:yes stop_codon:yes gene_type:complete
MSNSKCPVPKEQQPTNEYIELSNSLVFSLPRSNKKYALVLITVWIICFLIFLIISSGSVHFSENNFKYILISFFCSLSAPLLISIRLLLGWNHIFKRLIAEKVEYEESGWYDGQIWIKPVQLKEKETLIAFLEVKPILKKLSQITSIILTFILIGILIFQNINI